MDCDGSLCRNQVDSKLDGDAQRMLFLGNMKMSRSRYESIVVDLETGWYRSNLDGVGKNDDIERVFTIELLEVSRTETMQ